MVRPRHAAFVFSLLLISACSSAPSSRDRYVNLDYDSKTVFLTYYPYLSAEQREEFLANAEKNPGGEKELLRDWAGHFNDPDHRVGSFDEMMNNPVNRKLASLEVKLDAPETIVTGDRVTAQAIATYANGRAVDVTTDTEWKAEPHLGSMKKNVLTYDCVNSDITITGTFLGERQGAKTVHLRKPLKSLEVKVSEAYIGIDSGYGFQLNLLAHCADGSVSDVSCQASWKSVATGGRIQGCGNFIVTSKEKLAQDALTVMATYGDLSVRKTLHPPVR